MGSVGPRPQLDRVVGEAAADASPVALAVATIPKDGTSHPSSRPRNMDQPDDSTVLHRDEVAVATAVRTKVRAGCA